MACSPLCPLIVLRWSSRLNFWILLQHNYREIGILFQDSNSWNPYHASFKELLHRKRHTLVKVGHQHLVIKAMVRVGYDYLLEYLPLDKNFSFFMLYSLKFPSLVHWSCEVERTFIRKQAIIYCKFWCCRALDYSIKSWIYFSKLMRRASYAKLNQVLDLFFKAMCISFTS